MPALAVQLLVSVSSGFWYDWAQLVSPAEQEADEQLESLGVAEKPAVMNSESDSRLMDERSQ